MRDPQPFEFGPNIATARIDTPPVSALSPGMPEAGAFAQGELGIPNPESQMSSLLFSTASEGIVRTCGLGI